MAEVVSIIAKVDDRDMVRIYRSQAKNCLDIVTSLERMNKDNLHFFIQTRGFDQIQMHKDEASRRIEMANELEGVS